MTADQLDALARRTPTNRIGTPDDIAATAVFLASREAAFITGQAIAVDGGASSLPGDFSAYLTGSPRKDYG